ncbi:Gfo/Idh/MocA family protein [Haloferula sp. A504]|uniref:Gfo/Idh/MocA family protein n=1 Tax=Haloferula sp. A504 TaxID=3373601 RepID=UPI0031C5DF95|nr:Gfo/Idh/MocA family oxidoreductase [Verrucomicrobiaceae bacterium E54]
MKPYKLDISRRRFIKGAAGASAMLPLVGNTQNMTKAHRKIKIGLVGCGGRGLWIARLFQAHGGYQFHAVTDYFQAVADKAGSELSVDHTRCFSGLSGYRKVIESGVDAIVLEVPPYFFPEQAAEAVNAGLHVYMAKPVAVDVPGCLSIEASAQQASRQKKVFLIDYQIPTDPINIEVVRRIKDPAFGPIVHLQSYGICAGFNDPPRGPNLESRLQDLIWTNDIALGCDYIGNFDIHAIDAALWAIGERPVSACGASQVARPNPNGDSHDVCSVVYRYASGAVHNHFGQGLKNLVRGDIKVIVQSAKAHCQINYGNESFLHGPGELRFKGGKVTNLYRDGANRNIATFHRQITEGIFSNETVPRAIDGCLTCILGREAAERGIDLTMEQLLQENKKLEVDLKGLKT